MNIFKYNKGYTLLFAVITAALVLSVGVFILGVSKKQYALSISARESMYALYAADSAIECAARQYYYDTGNNNSGKGLAPTDSGGALRIPTLTCNGVLDIPGSTFVRETAATATSWDADLWLAGSEIQRSSGPIKVTFGSETNPPCALVTVVYGTDAKLNTTGGHDPVVRITSRGYNQCDSSGPLPSNRTVERALRLTASN